jgi:intein-encoded DNA endonuclease-like protein
VKHLLKAECAYIAGFLDGDGSLYIRLKPNKDYRFNYQIAPNIVFYQSQKGWLFLQKIKKMIGAGYMRKRNDGIAEYIIGDVAAMSSLLKQISPFLIF